MTYLVGYSPHKDDRCAIALACQLARSESDTVHALTVVPQGWGTPVGHGTDHDFEAWAQAEGEASAAEATALLAEYADVTSAATWVSARSAPAAILAQAEALDASIIVVGSGLGGPLDRVTVTSKTDRLLHSSGVPVAIAPRGYSPADGARITRVTVAFRDDDATWNLLERVADICRRTSSRLRLVTYALRHRSMVTTTVSGAEDMVFQQWRQQALAAQAEAVSHLATVGFRPEELESVIAEGTAWQTATDSLDWHGSDLLVVGSSSTHRLAEVFLGSSAAKIVRSSPVPVVVVP